MFSKKGRGGIQKQYCSLKDAPVTRLEIVHLSTPLLTIEVYVYPQQQERRAHLTNDLI